MEGLVSWTKMDNYSAVHRTMSTCTEKWMYWATICRNCPNWDSLAEVLCLKSEKWLFPLILSSPLPSLSFLGFCPKPLLQPHSQKTRVPGFRECEGVISLAPTCHKLFFFEGDKHCGSSTFAYTFSVSLWHWVDPLEFYTAEKSDC